MSQNSEQKPYYTFAKYIKDNFHTKAFRISVDGLFGCPEKCIYCENSYYQSPAESVEKQVKRIAEMYKRRFKIKNFYLYFQKGTSTAATPEKLRQIYDEGLAAENFIGLIIGTRPDYVDEQIIDLLKEYDEKYDVWVEYGLQSSFNDTLKKIKRGHSCEDFIRAVEMTHKMGIKCTVHLILGLPGETPEMMVESVRRISKLPVSGVKFHHLYILKNTELYDWYSRGDYRPLEYKEYLDIVTECLRNLREDIVVHRILGEDSTPMHVAPAWDRRKYEIIDSVKEHMIVNGFRQGDLFHC